MTRAIRAGLLLVLGLALYLCARAPTPGLAAPILAVVVYAVIAHYGVRTVSAADPAIVRAVAVCGVLSVVVFVPSILIEYAGRTIDNGVSLGAVAVCCGTAGAMAAWRTRRIGVAVYASTLSAMIGLLSFVIAVLGSYAVLRGTALQDRFFRTEGDYDDFARSGMTDFNRWVTEDLFGGVFFHLLLGALIAAAIGGLTGIVVIGCLRLLGSRRHLFAK